MSYDTSSSRPNHRKTAANENAFDTSLNDQIPPVMPSSSSSRAPLNSIPDPSQYQSKTPHVYAYKEKHDPFSSSFLRTPGVHSRGKSAHSEPNSAQSTPARSGAAYPRVPRGMSLAVPEQLSAGFLSFELDEDPVFWKDHNVQVLIRIRPFNSLEMASQGYRRCLRQESAQTVVWLGHPETRFTFDHIACENVSQEKLFRVAGLPMVDNCMSGYNSCMFAYGQTGSGKTYTMMGEIDRMDAMLSSDCGITPRIFEYLFTRITKEEESRKHERLTYSCKCSFLEIYNEHITDLLEPSSTNLQLREDSKKGVYVENLTEYSVRTVHDVLKLLQQGAANRKIAATHMNSESSRSHSVFTCIIESSWEKESMAHHRFGRLNLVDLAGSERQKSSGAEGDRLKEAANINKSLSTLGLVIMSLVDLAHGKHRHVPYRDSRLTFLLQDSLGGNSKTTIIANVSPSICAANETLSTLKFAQRAKLIQNNAKVNEDASGNVIALQKQIQQLQGRLSLLMKHQNVPIEVVDFAPSERKYSLGYLPERREPNEETGISDEHEIPKEGIVKMKHFRATLLGSLRREKLAEMEVTRLKAEIEHLNRLAHQHEEEAQRTKMILRFRDEKIKRLELLSDGLFPADKFYLDENTALREENLLLQAKLDRNPEVIRFALENMRLLEQIRLFQDFFEQGERDTLLAEVSELRNQLLESLEAETNYNHHQLSPMEQDQDLGVAKELERCKHMNSKLIREVDELQNQLENRMSHDQDTSYSVSILPRSDSVDEATSSNLPGDRVTYDKHDQQMEYDVDLQLDDVHKRLMDAQSLIETMKLGQSHLIKELEYFQTENEKLKKMLDNKEVTLGKLEDKHEYYRKGQSGAGIQDLTVTGSEGSSIVGLQSKLEKVSKELREAQVLNKQYTENHATRESQDHQAELVIHEVEVETAKTIMHLQEEMDRLQSEFHVQVCSMAEQNLSLQNTLAAKENEFRMICAEWERATMELTRFLIDGSRSLGDASCQINSISSSFPNVNDWISEHVEKAAKVCFEKEETILLLQKSLEDAQKTLMEMEHKLHSLKGATIAITDFQWPEESPRREEILLSSNDSAEKKTFPEHKTLSKRGYNTGNQANAPMMVENRVSNYFKEQCGGRYDQLTSQRIEAVSHNCEELAVVENHNSPSRFFAKFEEAYTTVKEADYMLKEMLKANQNANKASVMWKQAGEKLMADKASLSEEIKQLKSLLRNGETELHDDIHFTLSEKDNILSLLEEEFLPFLTSVDDLFETVHKDAIQVAKETEASFCSLRSSLEDLVCKAMQNDISTFLLQCQAREYFHKFSRLEMITNSDRSALQEHCPIADNMEIGDTKRDGICVSHHVKCGSKGDQITNVSRMEMSELDLVRDNMASNESELKRELKRKDTLLNGLLFDFSLLQELASNRKDIKDELENLIDALNQVQDELQMKTVQLDDMLVVNAKLEDELDESKQALFNSNSELDQAKETLNIMSEQNVELKGLLKDLYLKNSELDQLLEEQREAVESLEKEIIRLSSSSERQIIPSPIDIEYDLTRLTADRDELLEKLTSLQDKLDVACALADENQAIAAEARQESEANKLYAEQKEEEVKILEHSVEELESTINVLEKKVHEMEEEVENQRLIRDSLELQLQALRHRLLNVEDLTESMTSENSNTTVSDDQLRRKLHVKSLELEEARVRVKYLEEENAKQAKEIKQFKTYISELVLHAEAQASQYQQKYKTLEAMLHEVKTDLSNVSSTSTLERADKISTKTRGSSSPFKCIAGLVQQMNQEKDQELSIARLRIEELEALAASRYKEVCVLNTRLATAESMTHDVIRDLLSVKLDLSNYANMTDQHQLQKLIEEAQHQRQQFVEMEHEIVNLRSQIDDLFEERERCISEMNRSKADKLTSEIFLEQLQERDQLLIAQNDMLKLDKSKLQKRVSELDDMVKKLFSMQDCQPHNQPQRRNSLLMPTNFDLDERLAHSQKVLSRINNQHAQYSRPDGARPHEKMERRGSEVKFRKQKP